MPVLSPKRQVTLPKDLCDRLGLAAGDNLDLLEHKGRITIIRRSRGRSAGVLKHLALEGDGRLSDDESRDQAIAVSAGEIRPTRTHCSIRPAAELSGTGFRTYLRIAKVWNLSNIEQRRLLGDPPDKTYLRWKRDRVELSRDVLVRISHVLGIFKALEILFPDSAQARALIRRPNSATPFAGQSALEQMLSGNVSDIYDVRRYLDSQLV